MFVNKPIMRQFAGKCFAIILINRKLLPFVNETQ